MTRSALITSSLLLIALSGALVLNALSLSVLPACAQGSQPDPEVLPSQTPTPTPALPPTNTLPDSTPTSTPTITPSPRPHYGLPVFVDAEDGRRLVGDLHLINPAGPTVLLLHQLYTDRTSWNDVIGALVGAGINVLNVDVRGYGATGGAFDWLEAVNDVGVWLTYLRSTGWVRSDAIATMGSSMGSSLAILGCANDPLCRTAVAISPGWSYYDLNVEPAFTTLFGQRPVLLVYAQGDHWPSLGVPKIVEAATNPVTVQTYPHNQHGMDLFAWHDDLYTLVIEWLITHAG